MVFDLMNNETDFIVEQNYDQYSYLDHSTWECLFRIQAEILENRAAPEFLEGLEKLDIDPFKIPNFEELSDKIEPITGWRIIPVNGLVSDEVFFSWLANKRFPVTRWIRPVEKLDYIQEPDLFHDFYGHIPLLTNSFFSDFMELYGKKGLNAVSNGHLHYLARLYWYTTEFGLIHTDDGLRIYGSGIVSSSAESIYCLEHALPHRIWFDLERVMRTEYVISDVQSTYFVINSYEQLLNEASKKLTDLYPKLSKMNDYKSDEQVDTDVIAYPYIGTDNWKKIN